MCETEIYLWHGSFHEQDDELIALASKGMVHLGEGQIEDSFWQLPAPQVSQQALRHTLAVEREDG